MRQKHTPLTQPRDISAIREETVFLGSGSFLFRALLYGAGLSLPVIWLFNGGSWGNLTAIIVSHLIAMVVIGVPMTNLLKWLSRVRVTKEGICGGTIWGTPVYMKFPEMESVEPRSFVGMPYLRVRSFRESCPSLWIPCFLAKPDEFRQYITEHTSPAHPLRKSLENGNTSQKRDAVKS